MLRRLVGLSAAAALGLAAGPVPVAAAVLQRGPYLQQPTANSIIVRWRTDVATDSRVSYGTSVGSLTTMVDDATSTTEHEVTLTSLAADTQYFYEVGSTTEVLAGNDADHHFRTSPTTGTATSTRIWAIGDSGFPIPAETFGPLGAIRNGDAVRDAYIAYNGGVASADVWLLLGDNAYNTATDAEYQAALFEQYPGFVRTVAPWGCLGNHEGFTSNGIAETGPYYSVFTFPTGGEAGGVASGTESYYSFDYGNIHFVVLDAEDTITDATPGVRQLMLDWLEDDLMATTADWVIAFWHQPPYSKGFLHDSDTELNEILMREHVVPVLEDYGVDLVLTGHSHSYERSYLIDGHYGLSGTIDPSMILDPRKGKVVPYKKATVGPAPHEGAVHVVAGSASEVRKGALGNHPVMAVVLKSLGSFILDIDGLTATGVFLDEQGVERDRFRIVKGVASVPMLSLRGDLLLIVLLAGSMLAAVVRRRRLRYAPVPTRAFPGERRGHRRSS
jgi:hypothetical protein